MSEYILETRQVSNRCRKKFGGTEREGGKMSRYLRAECLKGRHSVERKLIFLVPAVLLFISLALVYAGVGLGSFSNALVCNWCVPVSALAVLLFCQTSGRREQKLQFRTIRGLPLDMKGVFAAKTAMTALYLLAATALLWLLSLAAEGVYMGRVPGISQAAAFGLGYGLLWLSLLWQIPLCLLLIWKIGFALSLVLILIASAVGGLFFSLTKLFWIFPHSWTARIMIGFFGILPNGLTVSSDMGKKISGGESFILALLSGTAALGLSLALAKIWERRLERE